MLSASGFTPMEQALLALVEPEYQAPDLSSLGFLDRIVYSFVDADGIELTEEEQLTAPWLAPGVTEFPDLTDLARELLVMLEPAFDPDPPEYVLPPDFPLRNVSPADNSAHGQLSEFGRALVSIIDTDFEKPDLAGLDFLDRLVYAMLDPDGINLTEHEASNLVTVGPTTQFSHWSDVERELIYRIDERFQPQEPSFELPPDFALKNVVPALTTLTPLANNIVTNHSAGSVSRLLDPNRGEPIGFPLGEVRFAVANSQTAMVTSAVSATVSKVDVPAGYGWFVDAKTRTAEDLGPDRLGFSTTFISQLRSAGALEDVELSSSTGDVEAIGLEAGLHHSPSSVLQLDRFFEQLGT